MKPESNGSTGGYSSFLNPALRRPPRSRFRCATRLYSIASRAFRKTRTARAHIRTARHAPAFRPEGPMITRRLAASLLFACCTPIVAHAQDPDIPFEDFYLDNGLHVVVHEDRKA